MKKTLIRSLILVSIVAVSLVIGYGASLVWDKAEKREYPLEYSEYIETASRDFGVPKKIIYAVIKTESGFSSSAQSSAGAIGLMQITPNTFEEITRKLGDNYEPGMMFDPQTNIRYGTYYLNYLYRIYDDWDVVFAAYNAGMGNVSKWLDDPKLTDDDGKLVNIPFAETEQYVKKVNDAMKKYVDMYGENF